MTASKPDDSSPDLAETHISIIFFAGDRAYKLLKPITTPYLDYGSTPRRLEAAHQELVLNQRLAPDVYLGTADVVEGGEVVDRMIVMRRLPADRRLNRLLWSVDSDDIVRSVARSIAAFHASLDPLDDVADIAGRDAVRANWDDNIAELSTYAGTLLDAEVHDRIVELVDRYLTSHGALFDRRIEAGMVREGHGDLTAEDIFSLDDGPRIIDCLAFSRRLRVSDVLADIAFLAMDLDRLAGADLARKLMRWYGEYSNEHHPPSLAHHYVAYRAHVRAKVEVLRHRQGDQGAASRARRYLELALDHLERAQLSVILVGGAPGTGKSTLCESLSTELGYPLLDSDTIRKDLAGLDHDQLDPAPLDEGSHSPAFDEATYATLTERAGVLLAGGESVVLDASWDSAQRRRALREVAAANGATCVELECDVRPEVATRRVEERLAAGGNPSDARPELLDELRERRDPWPESKRLDTSGPVERSLRRAIELIEGRRLRGRRTR